MPIKPTYEYNVETKKAERIMADVPEHDRPEPKKAIDMEKLITKLIAKGQLANRKEIEKDDVDLRE